MLGRNPKPAASLSSGLLARKGEARPAMRPQSPTDYGRLEDLGWNDMGEEPAATDTTPVPVVLRQREALRDELAAEQETSPADVPVLSAATVAQLQEERARRGKSAFTLRLDDERHLRLRIASAVRHVSAQVLVTQALDTFLSTMPEVDVLARQLPSSIAKKGAA